MGDFPWMTDRGTFIINGTERVVVTQLVRSPGAYLMEPKDRGEAGLHRQPDAGPRLVARARDRQEGQGLRPHRPQAQAAGHACCCARWATPTDEEILKLFDNSLYIRNTIEADTEVTRTEEGALIELFKKQRPGEPPSVDNARNLLNQLFFDPKRYDLTRVGRYKLNSRLGLDIDLETRTLTHDDIIALVRELVSLPKLLGIPEERRERDQGLRRRGAELPARAGRRPPRRVRALRQPPSAHRRRADPGGVPDRPVPDGARRARAPHHRGRRHDHAADDHQHPPGRGGAEGVLRLLAAVAVHGPDELAVRPDAPPPPVRARRRRPDARARADRGARRAPDPLRPHVPDRDAGGAEHRPDRLAVLASPRSPSTASSRRPTASSRTARSPTRSSTWTPPRRRSG